MIRQSYTASVERNRALEGDWASEPYECGWATEAIFFVRNMQPTEPLAGTEVRVQISPDGIRWCDEGTKKALGDMEVDFIRVRHFGNWLRLAGSLPKGVSRRLSIILTLKE